VLSLVPAAIMYKLVESPIRFSKRLQRYPKRVVTGAVALAVLTVLASVGAVAYANRVLAQPRYAPMVAAQNTSVIYDNGCQVDLLVVNSPACTFGPGRNDTTVVVFGDSHAAQWFPAFDSVATLRGWTFVNLTKTGCPSVMLSVANLKLGRRYFECETWRQNAIKRIVALHPALVVVTNVRGYNLLDGTRQIRSDSAGDGPRLWGEALHRTLTSLVPSGALLAVMRDTPLPVINVPHCLVRFVDRPAACGVARARGLDTVVARQEQAALQGIPRAAWVDLTGVMCDDKTCPAMRDGIVRYRDGSHISVPYAATLTPELSGALTRVLAERRP